MTPTTVLRLLRIFLLVAAAQGYAIGISGLLKPASVIGFPLETTPLNTRFVASFYLAGAIGLTISALARSVGEMTVLLVAFSVVTLLLLGVTIAYWSEFTIDGVPYPWLVSYIIDPVVGAAFIISLGLLSTAAPELRGPGLVFVVEAVVVGGLGVLMLAAPEAAIDVWPWKLSAVLARLYGAIFFALGVGAILAAQPRPPMARIPFLGTSLVLAVCGLVTYALHRSRFDGSTSTEVWLAAHALATVVFAATLGVVLRASSGSRPSSSVALEG